MPDSVELMKAVLIELNSDFKEEKSGGKRVTVQFNPDSLKVSFANQLATDGQKGTAGQLHVGAGTTKLSLQLWFDATRITDGDPVGDVRELTQRVTYFIKPQPEQGQENKFIPPAVRFQWGTFTFPGIVDAVEETLDYWSNDGKPLRASMTLSMCQQKIEALELANRNAGQAQRIAGLIGDTGRPPGTTPMTLAAFASTVQGLADKAGQGDWQSVAAANGIENPRLVPPGQLLNLNPTSRARRA